MSVKAYSFVSARIGAMRSYLLESASIKSIIEAPSWDDAVALLKDSKYGHELRKIPNPGMQEIEEILIKNLLHDYDKLVSSSKGEVRRFIDAMGRRFEVNAVKTIALSKILGMKRDEIKKQVIIPFGSITEQRVIKMLETENIEELVKSLRHTPYQAPMQKGLHLLEGEGSPFSLIALLDQHVYSELLNNIKKLDERDRKDATILVGTEVDGKNLLLALRCKGLNEEEVWKLFIRPWYKITADVIRSILSGDLDVLTSKRFPYRRYIDSGLAVYKSSGSLRVLELEMKRRFLEINRTMFHGDRFHIGILMGFLNLKENEIRNLIAVLRGKKDNLGIQDIKSLVILPDENT
jgi:V/A-type H+-transporting ATPase subunit C